LFYEWVTGGISIKRLIRLSKTDISSRQLIRYFQAFLDHKPQPKRPDTPREINLKCDAKYFGRFGCTIVFKERGNIIFWYYTVRENYTNYLYCFSKLGELGYAVKSVTSDKHGSFLSAVKTRYPNIHHQHCLVHIQMRCKTLLTLHPETQAGIKLLEISRHLNQIKTIEEKQVFLNWFKLFGEEYKEILTSRTYNKDPNSNKKWWYTHKNLRLAFNAVKSSLNNMFFYLEDSSIPKDTNGLEAEFTHLKQKLNMHRGLSRERRENFVAWYWYLKSRGK